MKSLFHVVTDPRAIVPRSIRSPGISKLPVLLLLVLLLLLLLLLLLPMLVLLRSLQWLVRVVARNSQPNSNAPVVLVHVVTLQFYEIHHQRICTLPQHEFRSKRARFLGAKWTQTFGEVH